MATTLTVLTDTVLAPNLLWDTAWDGIIGDWAPAAPTEPSNYGGLRARAPLETAIILCWMSDARADPTDEIPDGTGDPRGWAGDLVDTTADPLGSKFWLLRRSALTPAVAAQAILYGRASLQTLINQRACASIDVTAEANYDTGLLRLRAKLFKADGSLVADQQFDIDWKLSSGKLYPLDPDPPVPSTFQLGSVLGLGAN